MRKIIILDRSSFSHKDFRRIVDDLILIGAGTPPSVAIEIKIAALHIEADHHRLEAIEAIEKIAHEIPPQLPCNNPEEIFCKSRQVKNYPIQKKPPLKFSSAKHFNLGKKRGGRFPPR